MPPGEGGEENHQIVSTRDNSAYENDEFIFWDQIGCFIPLGKGTKIKKRESMVFDY